jgi:hypothetical protein
LQHYPQQPRYGNNLKNGWKKMWCIHKNIIQPLKRTKILPFVNNMDGLRKHNGK